MRKTSLLLALLALLLSFGDSQAWIAQSTASAPVPTSQVISGGGSVVVSTVTNRLLPFGYAMTVSGSSVVRYYLIPVPGNITKFYVRGTVAVTTGSYAVTVQKITAGSASNTSIACTLDSTHQQCEWTGTQSVSAGDVYQVLVDPSSGPAPDATPILRWSGVFQPTTAGDTIISGANAAVALSTSLAQVFEPQTGGNSATWSGSGRLLWQSPIAGTFDRLYADSNAPGTAGSGKSYDYSVLLNGTETALTTTIAETATANNNVADSFSVVSGDKLEFGTTPNSTPNAASVALGMRFVSSPTPGEYMFSATNVTNDDGAATYYYSPIAGGPITPTTTESDVQMPSYSQTIKTMACSLGTAPGAGKSRTFTLRNGGADTAATCTISGTNKTSIVTGLSVAIADYDLISMSMVPSGSPASSILAITFSATR